MAKIDDRKSIKCSFCGKPQSLVNRLIAGNGSYICDECVRLCMIYNYVNDALCVLGAVVENAFRVKDSDIRTATDFDVGEPFIEVRLALSIRIGQIVRVALAAGIAALKILLRHKRQQKKMLKEQLAA